MPDPIRQSTSEIASAAALAAAVFASGLLGALLGLAAGRRRGERGPYAGPARVKERVVWARLSELEARVADRDRDLETMRRDYDLDTGLLKQEIQRLELLLGRFSSGRQEPHRLTTVTIEQEKTPLAGEPTYHSLKLIEPKPAARAEKETVPFVPIARYADEEATD